MLYWSATFSNWETNFPDELQLLNNNVPDYMKSKTTDVHFVAYVHTAPTGGNVMYLPGGVQGENRLRTSLEEDMAATSRYYKGAVVAGVMPTACGAGVTTSTTT